MSETRAGRNGRRLRLDEAHYEGVIWPLVERYGQAMLSRDPDLWWREHAAVMENVDALPGPDRFLWRDAKRAAEQRDRVRAALVEAQRARSAIVDARETARLEHELADARERGDLETVMTLEERLAPEGPWMPPVPLDVFLAETPLAGWLDRTVELVRRFVVVSPAKADALALWVVHTWVLDAFDVSPYLVIASATMRSGKSLLLELLELLVARPWKVISPSGPVTFRKIARDCPTLLLDEYDTIWAGKAQNHEDLRAILNAGNRRGISVPRVGGPNHDRLDEFPVFCAKALAGIGQPPSTIADRAIRVEMVRRTKAETVERFRRRDVEPHAREIVGWLECWARAGASAALRDARPAVPDELDDRATEAWEPLLAIADEAAGDWPVRGRAAALELSSGAAREDDSDRRIRLLADIRAVFTARGATRLSSEALLEALTGDDESPWPTYHRGKPLTARGLGTLLRPFHVRSRTVRLDDGTTPKGYHRDQFEDAWNRYLAPDPGSHPPHPPQPSSHAGLSLLDDPPQDSFVADAKTGANPHERTDVADVADRTPEVGADEELDRLRDRFPDMFEPGDHAA